MKVRNKTRIGTNIEAIFSIVGHLFSLEILQDPYRSYSTAPTELVFPKEEITVIFLLC